MLPFRKILIANRGEIAVRVIRACQEMGIARSPSTRMPMPAALHTILADESVLLGPAPPPESYLRAELILQATLDRGCDAVHPGYGFLSENADFADAVQDAGLTFIGPSGGGHAGNGRQDRQPQIMRRPGCRWCQGIIPTGRIWRN